jgi:O-acetyl-ADP-ribose deacetylase (regulator of RNase III)
MSDVILEIIKGDITKQDVDAIVNAAHEALQGGGGVDGAIHRAAGPALLRECKEIPYVEPGVRCRPGEAFITSGCKLKARHVIHTVAPRFVGSVTRPKAFDQFELTKSLYHNAKPGTEIELANCYRNTIRLAAEHGIKSLAFCSLGTGGHSWPIEIAAPIAIKAAAECLGDAPELELVKFVCFSDYDLSVYNVAWHEFSGGE